VIVHPASRQLHVLPIGCASNDQQQELPAMGTWLSFETKAKARLPVRLGVGWLEASGNQRRPPMRTAGLAAPESPKRSMKLR
jgi:hypothetical protein